MFNVSGIIQSVNSTCALYIGMIIYIDQVKIIKPNKREKNNENLLENLVSITFGNVFEKINIIIPIKKTIGFVKNERIKITIKNEYFLHK